MSRRDLHYAIADHVALRAKDLGLRRGVARDPPIVLQVAREAEEDDAGNLLLHRRGQPLDGVVQNRGALAVPAHDQGRVGALGLGQGDDVGPGRDGRVVRALGQRVGRNRCRVSIFGPDALAGYLVRAELLLQGRASRGSGDVALGTEC